MQGAQLTCFFGTEVSNTHSNERQPLLLQQQDQPLVRRHLHVSASERSWSSCSNCAVTAPPLFVAFLPRRHPACKQKDLAARQVCCYLRNSDATTEQYSCMTAVNRGTALGVRPPAQQTARFVGCKYLRLSLAYSLLLGTILVTKGGGGTLHRNNGNSHENP